MKELSKSTKILIIITLIIVVISSIIIISSAFDSQSTSELDVVAPPTTEFSGFN